MSLKSLILAVWTGLLCGGCAPPAREPLIGTWSGSVQSADGTAMPLTLELDSEGRAVLRVAARSVAGTYALAWGNILRIDTDRSVAGKSAHQSKFTIEGDNLLLKDPDGASAQLRRVP